MLLPKVVIPVVGALAIYVVTWLSIEPLEFINASSDGGHTTYSSCASGPESMPFSGVLVFLEGAFLLYGAFLSYKVRSTPSEFNESAHIGLCIYISFLLGAVIVPILFILGGSSPIITALLENALGLFLSWTVQLLIFGPKVLRIVVDGEAVIPSILTSKARSSVASKVTPSAVPLAVRSSMSPGS
jgi:hypothetical protein